MLITRSVVGARSSSRAVAVAIALLVPLLLVPMEGAGAEPPASSSAPSLALSRTDDLDPGGEVVTVVGTGFDPAAHVGSRPPLAGQPSGVYVVFGRFGDPWRPSEGAPSSAAG